MSSDEVETPTPPGQAPACSPNARASTERVGKDSAPAAGQASVGALEVIDPEGQRSRDMSRVSAEAGGDVPMLLVDLALLSYLAGLLGFAVTQELSVSALCASIAAVLGTALAWRAERRAKSESRPPPLAVSERVANAVFAFGQWCTGPVGRAFRLGAKLVAPAFEILGDLLGSSALPDPDDHDSSPPSKWSQNARYQRIHAGASNLGCSPFKQTRSEGERYVSGTAQWDFDGHRVELEHVHELAKTSAMLKLVWSSPESEIGASARPRISVSFGDELGARLTGDRTFDRVFVIDGPGRPEVALAALSAEARAALLALEGNLVHQVWAEGAMAAFRLERNPCLLKDLDGIDDLIGRCAVVAKTLTRDRKPLLDGLLHNARHDPNPQIRARNRRMLLLQHTESAQAEAIAASGLESDDVVERAVAGIVLGSVQSIIPALTQIRSGDLEAHPVLVRAYGLAVNVSDEEGPESGRSNADTLAMDGTMAAAVATVQAVIESGHGWSGAWLAERFERRPELINSALAHLLLADMADLEALLLAALAAQRASGRQVNPNVLVEVIEKLGQIGTVKSVPELRTHCDEFFDPTYGKKPARAAIAAIQARVKGGEVGQLAVVTDDDIRGGLSDADEDA